MPVFTEQLKWNHVDHHILKCCVEADGGDERLSLFWYCRKKLNSYDVRGCADIEFEYINFDNETDLTHEQTEGWIKSRMKLPIDFEKV